MKTKMGLNVVNDISLVEKFFTSEEKELLSNLPLLTEEERVDLETLADYLIDAALESLNTDVLKKGIKDNKLEVQNG
jgi:hypothetical protein